MTSHQIYTKDVKYAFKSSAHPDHVSIAGGLINVWASFELGPTHVVEGARRNKGLTLQAAVPHDAMENLMFMRPDLAVRSPKPAATWFLFAFEGEGEGEAEEEE